MSNDSKYHPRIHLSVPLTNCGATLIQSAAHIDMLASLDALQRADNGARAQLLAGALEEAGRALTRAQRSLESYRIAMEANLVLLTGEQFDALRTVTP